MIVHMCRCAAVLSDRCMSKQRDGNASSNNAVNIGQSGRRGARWRTCRVSVSHHGRHYSSSFPDSGVLLFDEYAAAVGIADAAADAVAAAAAAVASVPGETSGVAGTGFNSMPTRRDAGTSSPNTFVCSDMSVDMTEMYKGVSVNIAAESTFGRMRFGANTMARLSGVILFRPE
jgi:hypothetical protein